MDAQAETIAEHEEVAITLQIAQAAEDYAREMFEDGHSRADHDPLVANAPDYDAAAHTVDREINDAYELANNQPSGISDTYLSGYSREGTGASGRDDADGGHLGGREEELDALEASGAPVDKTPRMKE